MSRCLAERSIDHVVLERGEVANSWRTERWDSLRLLTPNWQSRLPGFGYDGDDPDGYRTMPEVIEFLDRYASVISAPVADPHEGDVGVADGRRLSSSPPTEGDWRRRTVVIATGACNVPCVPTVAEAVPPGDRDAHARWIIAIPDQLADGGVLVVGASATGIQLADEIHRSGRPVTLAVGEHVRAPRTYRGRDIQWWMDAAGVLDQRYDEVDDIVRARRVPSLQLVGSPERQTLDLNALTRHRRQLVGRLAGIGDGKAQFSGSLHNQCAIADLKMNRLLDTIDEWATENGLDGEIEPPHRFAPTEVEGVTASQPASRRGRITHDRLGDRLPPRLFLARGAGLDRKGQIRHDGGVTERRHVSDRHAVPAPPQIRADRRRGDARCDPDVPRIRRIGTRAPARAAVATARRPGGGRMALRAQRLGGVLPPLLVADRRVVDARQLQVGRDLHPCEGDEADAGVVHLAAASISLSSWRI